MEVLPVYGIAHLCRSDSHSHERKESCQRACIRTEVTTALRRKHAAMLENEGNLKNGREGKTGHTGWTWNSWEGMDGQMMGGT